MEESSDRAEDLVTVSMRRPTTYYASTLYAKFRSNEILHVEGRDQAIAPTAEIVQTIQATGDATIESLSTSYSGDHFRTPHIHISLKRTSQLEEKFKTIIPSSNSS